MGPFMCKLQISEQRNQNIRNYKSILMCAYGSFVRNSTLTLKAKRIQVIYDAFPRFNQWGKPFKNTSLGANKNEMYILVKV